MVVAASGPGPRVRVMAPPCAARRSATSSPVPGSRDVLYSARRPIAAQIGRPPVEASADMCHWPSGASGRQGPEVMSPGVSGFFNNEPMARQTSGVRRTVDSRPLDSSALVASAGFSALPGQRVAASEAAAATSAPTHTAAAPAAPVTPATPSAPWATEGDGAGGAERSPRGAAARQTSRRNISSGDFATGLTTKGQAECAYAEVGASTRSRRSPRALLERVQRNGKPYGTDRSDAAVASPPSSRPAPGKRGSSAGGGGTLCYGAGLAEGLQPSSSQQECLRLSLGMARKKRAASHSPGPARDRGVVVAPYAERPPQERAPASPVSPVGTYEVKVVPLFSSRPLPSRAQDVAYLDLNGLPLTSQAGAALEDAAPAARASARASSENPPQLRDRCDARASPRSRAEDDRPRLAAGAPRAGSMQLAAGGRPSSFARAPRFETSRAALPAPPRRAAGTTIWTPRCGSSAGATAESKFIQRQPWLSGSQTGPGKSSKQVALGWQEDCSKRITAMRAELSKLESHAESRAGAGGRKAAAAVADVAR